MDVCKIEYVDSILESIEDFFYDSGINNSDTSLQALTEYVEQKNSPDIGEFNLNS